MKFTKHTFLMLGMATLLTVDFGIDAMAAYCNNDADKRADPGYVCLYNATVTCRPGCYCKGGGYEAVSKGDFEDGCLQRWPSWENHGGGWTLCPSDWPISDGGAKSEEDCYVTYGNQKLHNKYVTCKKGTDKNKCYLPMRSEECAKCPEGFVCDMCNRNNTYSFHTSQTTDQGAKRCDEGLQPNSDQTQCVAKPITCAAGAYLPAGAETCEACLSGYVCLGSTKLQSEGWYKTDGVDQGLLLPKDACVKPYFKDNDSFIANSYGDGCDECPIGTKANADHTECVETSIKVTKGYYLPANSVQQQKCSNPKKFCPGGNFWKSSVEQGQYDCPFTGTSASSNYQRCTVTLSEEQLRFGVMGNNGSQCWSKTDPEDFQYCVLGLRGIQTMDVKGLRDTLQRNIQQNTVSVTLAN